MNKMKYASVIRRIHALCGKSLAAVGLLCACLPASAYLVDPFTNAVRTGWSDVPNGGSFSYAPHAFGISSSPTIPGLTYSKYTGTGSSFSYQVGHTLEMKVKVNGIGPAAASNGHAVLGWVASGGSMLGGVGNSFNLRVGVSDIQIRNGSTVPLYSTNLATALSTTNVFLVLRITPLDGSSQRIKASVYSQSIAYAPPWTASLMFEHTCTNTASMLSSSGNLALGAENSPSGAAATASFDRLEAFDTIDTVLDPLQEAWAGCSPCGGLDSLGWYDIAAAGAISQNGNNQLQIALPAGATVNAAFRHYYPVTFSLTEGSRLQFSVDIPVGTTIGYNVPMLQYVPAIPNQSFNGYYIVQNNALMGTGKSLSYSWVSPFSTPTANPNGNNMRYTLIMTGEGGGTQVRCESRIEDVTLDLNDPARVWFRTEFVDGPAFGGAWTNINGYFSLEMFHNSQAGNPADLCAFTNAVVSYTPPVNRAPIIQSLSPIDGANFVDASSSVSFVANDDANQPAGNITLTLNGVTYTSTSPGVTVTGTTAVKTFTLAGGALVANTFYKGTISATDNTGLNTTKIYQFDTFLTNNFVLESEEFNFSPDSGVTGGAFIDNPVLVYEGWVDNNAYNGREGLAEVDFHDNQSSGGTYPSGDHAFRPDPPQTARSGDGPRAKYVNAGGAGAGYYEDMVMDIANNDWLNYTHSNYPSGTFNVFIRQSQFFLPRSLVTLDRVLSDPTNTVQPTAVLGSFMQLGDAAGDTGYDIHRNVPLTDVSGNPMVLRLPGGFDTLRVSDRYVDDDFGLATVFQNYLVFVPATDPGVGNLRPVVSMASPTPNSTFRSSPMPEATTAAIANRDTTVVSNTIALTINGTAMPITIQMVTNASGTEVGANVTWPLASTPAAALLNAQLTFQDNTGAHLTNAWSYSYPFLAASKGIPIDSVSSTNLGWSYQMAQTCDGAADGCALGNLELGNTITRAIQQLSSPPEIPSEISYVTNNVQTLFWGDNVITPLTEAPGLPAAAPESYWNIAIRVLGYMHLTAGAHRFSADCDEGWEMWLGFNLNDPNQPVIANMPSDNSSSVDFIAEKDALYPIQIIYQNSRKAYHFALYSVDLATNTRQALINDTGSPVQVYSPAAVDFLTLSATSPNGPYTAEYTAVVNQVARTVTVPISGATKFFRLYGSATPAITNITAKKVGSNIVLSY
jgi:hypothetical protein